MDLDIPRDYFGMFIAQKIVKYDIKKRNETRKQKGENHETQDIIILTMSSDVFYGNTSFSIRADNR